MPLPEESTPARSAVPAGPALRLERVEPGAVADAAAEVLRSAWQPPCLHYSREHVAWRFDSPSALPPLGYAVFQGDRMIAFSGAFGIRIQCGPEERDVYLCSFFSVRPGTPGAIAAMLSRAEARHFLGAALSGIVFTPEHSTGEQMLSAWEMLGMDRYSLGVCIAHAGMAAAVPQGAAAGFVSEEEWLSGRAELAAPGNIVQMPFGLETLEHQLRDPSGRRAALARGPDGAVTGAALVASTEMVSKSGPQTVISLHYVRATTPDGLRALIALALEGRPRAVAMIPNRAALSDPVLRGAGVRATPTRFASYVLFPRAAQRWFSQAVQSEIEVI